MRIIAGLILKRIFELEKRNKTGIKKLKWCSKGRVIF